MKQKNCPECGALLKTDPKTGDMKCPVCGTVRKRDPFEHGTEQPERKNIYVLRWITLLLANLTAILSANYLVFYILDHFNPNQHYVVRSDFFLTRYLHYIIPALILLTALLYLLLLVTDGFKQYRFNKKHFIMLLIADVLIAGTFAMAVNVYTFDWLNCRSENLNVALPTMPPAPTAEPTEIPTPEPTETPTPEPTEQVTPAPGASETPVVATPEPTPEPTEAPTPEPTPIPGLLGDKYKEKFSDGEPFETTPNTSETLEDGTVRTLVYTYSGRQSAIEIWHYRKDKLEYQIAEIYVRDIRMLNANYVTEQGDPKLMREFVQEADRPILAAINSDYFVANAISEGLIIRNNTLIRNRDVKYSDLCVVFQDGTVRCYDCKTDTIDNNEILGQYPYHSFHFGPSLLDADGNAKEKFNSTLGSKNPRTVFGYYEPGHYAFLCVLGDRTMRDIEGKDLGEGKSPGMTLTELSELCHSFGMRAAYNFDGGGSSGMYWNGTMFGHNDRTTSDILTVIDE